MDAFQEMIKTKLDEERRISCENGKRIWTSKISPKIDKSKISAITSNQLEILSWTTLYSLDMTEKDCNDLKYYLEQEMPSNYRLELERIWIRKCLRLVYYN